MADSIVGSSLSGYKGHLVGRGRPSLFWIPGRGTQPGWGVDVFIKTLLNTH